MEKSWKTLIWENRHRSLIMCIWVALKENSRSPRILWIITEVCSNQGFLSGLQRSCQKQKPRWNLMPTRYLHGLVTRKVMQRNVWKDVANLRIKRLSKKTKSQRHAWMIINSKSKMDQWENYPMYSYKILWITCAWLELVDQTSYGS